MNANREWLSSAPVTAACQKLKAQREAEESKAKWALEFLESDIARLGHFYLEVGDSRVTRECGSIERKNGRFVVSRSVDQGRFRDPLEVIKEYDSLLDALVGLTEDVE